MKPVCQPLSLLLDNAYRVRLPIMFLALLCFCNTGKEIQLKHRAPVVSIAVIDAANRLVSEAMDIDEKINRPSDNSYPHHVIIGSEEQFKVTVGEIIYREKERISGTCLDVFTMSLGFFITKFKTNLQTETDCDRRCQSETNEFGSFQIWKSYRNLSAVFNKSWRMHRIELTRLEKNGHGGGHQTGRYQVSVPLFTIPDLFTS